MQKANLLKRHVIYICTFLLLLTGLWASVGAYGQGKTRIHVLHADAYNFNARLGKDVQRLIGHVKLKQDSTLFFSDSAFLNDKKRNFDAFGRVHINVNDTLNLYGDRLHYNGKTRIAELFGHVVLQDEKARLTTNHLVYNRLTRIAFYDAGGTIYSDSNILKSKQAIYNTQSNIFHFRKEVVLSNPDQVTRADTLIYNTNNKTAYFRGPTLIKDSQSTIRCVKGWYDTRRDVSKLMNMPVIESNGQQLTADSLEYNNHTTFGRAFGRLRITDTLHSVIVEGRVGEMWDNKGITYVTDSAMAITYYKGDSLFIHADTLWVYFDRNRKTKKMLAYNGVRFYRDDLQGKCDSLSYVMSDSSLNLYKLPVLWSGKNQLTADSMQISIGGNHIDSLNMYNNAFIISRDSLTSFNQISGRMMTGYFKQNKIYKMNVEGNAQSIYWVRDDDKRLIGVNKAEASSMVIRISNNQIRAINYLEQPSQKMFPETELTKENRYLKGFQWLEKLRPFSKLDIFSK